MAAPEKERDKGAGAPRTRGEKQIDRQSRREYINLPLVAAIVGVATIGGFMFGYDSGVINGTQDGLQKHLQFERGVARHHRQRAAAGLRGRRVSGRALGGSSGAGGGSWLAAAMLFILSALAAGAAASAVMMIVARFAAGVGVGAASVLSPAYISEVTPASMRGRLVERAAGHDHRRTDRRVSRQLFPGAWRRPVHRRLLAGLCRLALDVLDAGHSGERLSPDAAAHSGESALPGGARPRTRKPWGC